jgi:hypothetical protein
MMACDWKVMVMSQTTDATQHIAVCKDTEHLGLWKMQLLFWCLMTKRLQA